MQRIRNPSSSSDILAPGAGLLGELMIRSLKMLVLPLVAGCMIASVCALGDAGNGMGRTAAWTLGMFLATSCVAAGLGVTLAAVFHPGHDADLSLPGVTTGITSLLTCLVCCLLEQHC